MKHLLLLFVLFLFSILTLHAGDNYPVGARSAGVANASVTFSDEWSSCQNQAGLSDLKKSCAGIYFENKFLLPDFVVKSFSISVPSSKAGTFAVSVTSFGETLYRETKAGFGYAKKLGEKFSAGIQLDYLSTFIADNYGSRSSMVTECGIIAEPITHFKIGVHLFNPNRAKTSDNGDEFIPVILRIGASYLFSEHVLVCAEEEKDISMQPQFKTGLEYHIADVIHLRCGIASDPTVSTFGFGIRMKHYTMDFASSWHQELGFSPHCSLGYVFH